MGKFVEFYGPGLSKLTLADRATIANMAPEYGATMGFFPVDEETLRYLVGTGRDEELVELVERYTKEQGLFRTDATPDPLFIDSMELDMSTVEPALAGPKRPQDRIDLDSAKTKWNAMLTAPVGATGLWPGEGATWQRHRGREQWPPLHPQARRRGDRGHHLLHQHQQPVGHDRRRAAGQEGRGGGLDVKPWVKTSLAPGSKVVTRYLDASGLTPYLEALELPHGRLWLHHLHRQQRPPARTHPQGHPRGGSGGVQRAQRQPQL